MKIPCFEFEDQYWFPATIRDYMTDYLRFLFCTFKVYQPVVPLLNKALEKANTSLILDLCSGSGGAMEFIYNNLKQSYGKDVKITLSDLYPSLLVYRHIYEQTSGGVSYVPVPVDACFVPQELKGFRTLFSGFHHFKPDKATAILKNSILNNSAIGIFDGGDKNGWMILAIIIIHLLLIVFCTPFIRPFRFSRLLLTYLVPVIPFCTIWDGIASIIKLYSPEEMLIMARNADSKGDFSWTSGKVKNRFGMNIAYLIGYPIREKTKN